MITIQKIEVTDVDKLCGHYIIQLNNDKHSNDIKNSISFYAEKRIARITPIDVPKQEGEKRSTKMYFLAGINYNHSKIVTAEEIVEKFNNGDSEGERYYRLMTRKEVDILNDYLFVRQEEML